MRTKEQIINKIKLEKDNDFFGVICADLATYLPIEEVQKLFPEADLKDFKTKELTRENVLQEIKDYLEFAWDKANNQRGLSAGRSMDHFTAWIWLLGDEDSFGDLRDYQYYGKDNLVEICEFYNLQHLNFDDGVREN